MNRKKARRRQICVLEKPRWESKSSSHTMSTSVSVSVNETEKNNVWTHKCAPYKMHHHEGNTPKRQMKEKLNVIYCCKSMNWSNEMEIMQWTATTATTTAESAVTWYDFINTNTNRQPDFTSTEMMKPNFVISYLMRLFLLLRVFRFSFRW